MKTIRIFRRLPGCQREYEHYADRVDGTERPVADDTVYTKDKAQRTFVATRARILCPSCGYPRHTCHCAPHANEALQAARLHTAEAREPYATIPPKETLALVVEAQRQRGMR